MKASRVFLVILIVAAAFTAAVNIFSDSRAEVEVKEVSRIEYADHVILSGTVYETANVTQGNDGSVEALTGANSLSVTAYVGENNVGEISLGQSAIVEGSGFKDKTYSATVTQIGDTAKKVTVGGVKVSAVEVTLKINDPDQSLKSGFTAKVKIFTEDKSDILTVPYSAVISSGGKEYVYLYVDKTAKLTPIKTGRELSNGYEVVSGLSSGDIVVTTPQKIKSDNCNVTVLSEVQ